MVEKLFLKLIHIVETNAIVGHVVLMWQDLMPLGQMLVPSMVSSADKRSTCSSMSIDEGKDLPTRLLHVVNLTFC